MEKDWSIPFSCPVNTDTVTCLLIILKKVINGNIKRGKVNCVDILIKNRFVYLKGKFKINDYNDFFNIIANDLKEITVKLSGNEKYIFNDVWYSKFMFNYIINDDFYVYLMKKEVIV